MIFISLSPYCFRLRLNTFSSIKNNNCTIKYSQRPFYLCSKIYMTRCIYNINSISLPIKIPKTCNSSRLNSNSSFSFLLHKVSSSSTLIYLSNFMNLPCKVQKSFSSSCFSCIYMSDNSNIPYLLKRHFYIIGLHILKV